MCGAWPAGARLAVFGPGTLGRSLAAFAVERGISVNLAGRDREHAEAGAAIIWARRQRRREGVAGKGPADCARLEVCASVEEAMEGAAALLEALPESLDAKRQAWARIARGAAPELLLLTGSSSLALARIRERILPGPRLLGFHLFLPLHRMDALELVSEPGTDPGLLDRAGALAAMLGRTVFRIQDGPGYAASRMALAQGLEAMRLLERGAARAEDLDGLLVRGYGHPVGPLELSDRIGLDLRLSIARGLHAATGSPAFEPPAILQELVRRGDLGRKTGRGFHEWDTDGRRR